MAGDPERPNRMMLTIIAIVGAILCVAGWYTWAM